MITRDDCLRDAMPRDPLAPLRDLFALERVDRRRRHLPRWQLARRAAEGRDRPHHGGRRSEWGSGLIRSWNTAGWITLSQRIGDKIAPLVGAGPGEVIVADSTSVNLFKALERRGRRSSKRPARIAASSPSARTFRPTSTSPRPFAREHGLELVLVDEPRDRVAPRRSRRHPDADARQLPHRPHARHGAR